MKKPIQSAYEKLALSQPYQRVDFKLKLITWTTATISAVATAYGNGLSHKETIGVKAAWALGVGIFLLVEFSLYTLEQGLRETFKGGTQRALATVGKWIIKVTMVANAAWMCCKIAGAPVPELLSLWNKWSFVIHFGIGLLLIPAIRDADPVVASRMLQLRAETAQEDQIISRLATALASPFPMVGVRLRGWFDSMALAWRLLRNPQGFDTKEYRDNLNQLGTTRFGYVTGQKQLPPGPVQPANAAPTARFSAPLNSAPYMVPVKQNPTQKVRTGKQNPAKVPQKNPKTGSGSGVSLPAIPKVRYEPNNKGGIEAWFRPSPAASRKESVYLCHIGKNALAVLATQPDRGEEGIRQTVMEAATRKSVILI